MTRISDEELDIACRAPDDDADPWPASLVRKLAHELRERRAADLSNADRDALRWLVEDVNMLRDRLARIEPVMEAAKAWRERYEQLASSGHPEIAPSRLTRILCDAIDAALAEKDPTP